MFFVHPYNPDVFKEFLLMKKKVKELEKVYLIFALDISFTLLFKALSKKFGRVS